MLTLKAGAVLVLMIVVGYLTIRARRFNFDRHRSVHSRRKYRVAVGNEGPKAPEEGEDQ